MYKIPYEILQDYIFIVPHNNMPEFYYKELSEQVIGLCFNVYNETGYGYREKFYETALKNKFATSNVKQQNQPLIPLSTPSGLVVYRRADFNIDNKIILELKVGIRLTKKDYDQLNEYLKAVDYRLGLLVLFSPYGVIIRRVVNIRR